jgi:uncharacterized membrane protein
MDPGFVGPEADTIFGALFEKKNTKLWIQNKVHKWIFLENEKSQQITSLKKLINTETPQNPDK